MALLTIIVPVYNVKDYIKQCLESILKQSFKDFQCYIVDDGCKDESITIANNIIKDDNRFTILHKENGGLSDARNYALPYVKSKYLTFIDSDDYIDIDHYEKIIKLMENNNSDLCVCNVNYFFNDASKNYTLKGLCDWPCKDNNHAGILSPMFAWNKVYSSELFFKYDSKYPLGLWYEDLPVSTILFAKANNITYCENTCVYYRQREGSIMSENNSKRVIEIFTILQLVRDRFKQYNIEQEFKNELEYLHIEHLRLYGMFRFLRNDNKDELITLSNKTMQQYYPNYKKNKYIKNLAYKYQLFIRHYKLLKGFIK